MARNPFGTPSFLGTRGGANLAFRYETGIELQRFARDLKGHFIKGMPGNLNEAHRQVGYLVTREVYKVLDQRMREHSPRRQTRPTQKLRRALRGDDPIYTLIPMSRRGAGVSIDWDDVLNARVRDERGTPYWRAVEVGYEREAIGHLFFSNVDLGGAGRYSGPYQRPTARLLGMVGGADPRMPKVRGVEWTRFTYSFEGYHFVRDGMKNARRKLSRAGIGIYLDELEFPDEMLKVAQFYGSGGRGSPRAGGRFIADPRRRQF